MIYGVLVVVILGLLYAMYLRNQVLREDTGTPAMQKVWNAIKTSALPYLSRQARSIIPLIAILTVA
jgi:K(+)-stimulated pyrophosphate-energized sodium pump